MFLYRKGCYHFHTCLRVLRFDEVRENKIFLSGKNVICNYNFIHMKVGSVGVQTNVVIDK